VCTEEELFRAVNKFNGELSMQLSDVDTHVPKVYNSHLCSRPAGLKYFF